MGSPNDLHYIKTVCPTVTGSVLEIGARENSTGFRQYFAPTAAEYIGTDLVPGSDVDVVCDLTAPENPLPKNHFDLAICCSVMEHVPNPWVMAEKIAEVVKPGGKLYICVPWVWRYHAYPDDYYRYSFRAIEYLFPDFVWDRYAYSSEVDGDIRWINKNEIGRDNKWAYFARNDQGKKIKKYLPYLLINLIGTKSA